MKTVHFILIVLAVVVSLFIRQYVNESSWDLTDRHTCPYCYGLDYCPNITNVMLQPSSWVDLINNLISVKNVVIGDEVVLKKLAHQEELEDLDRRICLGNGLEEHCDLKTITDNSDYKKLIIEFLYSDHISSFKLCNGINTFLKYLLRTKSEDIGLVDFYKNTWTVLRVNIEPIILQLLIDDWPVPKYYGSCGRCIAVEYVGKNLNDFKDHKWEHRAYLALQLLEAAHGFTTKHPDFRFYLTDISPDNIAVDNDLKLRFVDLEHVIIVSKKESEKFIPHHSTIFGDATEFSFSENEICASSMSDHNYFSICQLLLSKEAPWPMMTNGLLHSIPKRIKKRHPKLVQMVEDCVQPVKYTRFDSAFDLTLELKTVLYEENYFDG